MLKKVLISTMTATVLLTPITALAKEHKPLDVQLLDKMPEQKPLQEIQVPTFSDGLKMLTEQWGSTQQTLAPVLMKAGDTSLKFSLPDAPESKDMAAKVFAGLMAGLPDVGSMQVGKLPDVNTDYVKAQQDNADKFQSALGNNPFPHLDPKSLAGVDPSLTAGKAQFDQYQKGHPAPAAPAHQSVDLNNLPDPHVKDLPPMPPVVMKTPDGWKSDPQAPEGWKQGVFGQISNMIKGIMGMSDQLPKMTEKAAKDAGINQQPSTSGGGVSSNGSGGTSSDFKSNVNNMFKP